MKRFWLLVALFTSVPGTVLAAQSTASVGFLGTINAAFVAIVSALEKVIFLSIGGMPLVILWLLAGAIFLPCG